MEDMNKKIINGIEVTEDGDVTHFSVSEETKAADEKKRKEEIERKEREEMSWWDKFVGLFKTGKVKPYVKVRDLADPFNERRYDPDDFDAGCDGRTGVEAGIKVEF